MMNDINENNPEAPPMFSVAHAMELCGATIGHLYQGQNDAQRLAEDIFSDTYETCLGITWDALEEDFKTFAELPAAAGRIRLVLR
jgi:hypothetical protein